MDSRDRSRWIHACALLVASVAIHGSGMVAITLRTGATDTNATIRGDNGDRGQSRATVTTEFSVPEPSPPPPPPPPVTRPIQSSQQGISAGPAHTTPASEATTTTEAPSAATTAPRPAAPPRTPQPTTVTVAAAPTRRTGSIGEQRGLLPAAARCNDPVAGTWRAHRYDPRRDDWVLFTLRIQRHPDNRLYGAITARTWGPDAGSASPPGRCLADPSSHDYLVSMEGNGMLTRGTHVTFSAIEAHVTRAYCRIAQFRYDPDAFSGDIDVARQEFNSVNDDGNTERNVPYVFRRIGCLRGDVARSADSTSTAVGGSVAP